MGNAATNVDTTNESRESTPNDDSDAFEGQGFHRREFVQLAAAMAAGTAATMVSPTARSATARQPAASTMPPPANSLGPAVQFQAAPGGSGAWLEAAAQTDAGNTDARLDIPKWEGDAPANEAEIAYLPVHRLAALLRTNKLSSVGLTEIYLNRLKRLDEKLLCAVTIMEDSALAGAKRADNELRQGKDRGPLHGIPWGVKDLFSTRGVRTTWGAKPFEHRIIDEDAELVVRLQEAGAVLVAKLSTGTFAQGDAWYRGRTRNPWNLEQGSSGSSAGPGSATAAGCVGFAIGTETQGSITSPAKRCGISALRPTHGRVTRHGCMTLSWSMDKAGPMCRTIEDCALVFDAIHGADPKDSATLTAPFRFRREPDLSKLRIGYAADVDPAFLDQLRSMGAKPREIGRRPSSGRIGRVLNIEAAAAFDDFLATQLEDQMVRKDRPQTFRRGQKVSAVDYLNAQRQRQALMQEMDTFMAEFDMYVTLGGDVALTNLTGHPAAVVPYRFASTDGGPPSADDSGQPQCMTIIGRLFGDDEILSVAHAYQQATAWHRKHPEL